MRSIKHCALKYKLVVDGEISIILISGIKCSQCTRLHHLTYGSILLPMLRFFYIWRYIGEAKKNCTAQPPYVGSLYEIHKKQFYCCIHIRHLLRN